MSPSELIEKLAALIPPPRLNVVRYHGVFAPAQICGRLAAGETHHAAAGGQIVSGPEPEAEEGEGGLRGPMWLAFRAGRQRRSRMSGWGAPEPA